MIFFMIKPVHLVHVLVLPMVVHQQFLWSRRHTCICGEQSRNNPHTAIIRQSSKHITVNGLIVEELIIKMYTLKLAYFVFIIDFKICVLHGQAVANQAQMTQFTVSKCGNIAACAMDKASVSFTSQSQGQCVLECQRKRTQPSSCVGVNYRKQLRMCELFFSSVTKYAQNIAGCQYIQVGLCHLL